MNVADEEIAAKIRGLAGELDEYVKLANSAGLDVVIGIPNDDGIEFVNGVGVQIVSITRTTAL